MLDKKLLLGGKKFLEKALKRNPIPRLDDPRIDCPLPMKINRSSVSKESKSRLVEPAGFAVLAVLR